MGSKGEPVDRHRVTVDGSFLTLFVFREGAKLNDWEPLEAIARVLPEITLAKLLLVMKGKAEFVSTNSEEFHVVIK